MDLVPQPQVAQLTFTQARADLVVAHMLYTEPAQDQDGDLLVVQLLFQEHKLLDKVILAVLDMMVLMCLVNQAVVVVEPVHQAAVAQLYTLAEQVEQDYLTQYQAFLPCTALVAVVACGHKIHQVDRHLVAVVAVVVVVTTVALEQE
jgi:hypothetical protein